MKAQPVPKKHLLSQAQLETLTSPVRLAIVQRLEIDKQATACELARRMGYPVTALYHHLKQLEDAGVLRMVAERRGVGRPETVYALIAEYLSSAKAVKTRPGRKAYGRAASRVADAGARAFAAAVMRGSPKFAGKHRNTMAKFYLLRADKDKLARLNELLDELDDAAVHSREDGEEVQLTILLSPVQRKG